MNTFKNLAFAFLALVVAETHASVIQSPTSATASSTFSGCCDIVNTINQNGLLSGFTSGVTDFDSYVGTNPLHSLNFNTEWFAPSDTTSATVVYDMGSAYLIDRIAYWNEETGNGFLQFDIFGSLDGVVYSLLAAGLTPTDHPAEQDYPVEVFGWAAQSFRYFQLDLACDWCSIGEVAFSVNEDTGPTVPVPATLALFGIGLAGFGWSRRRKA